MLGVYRPPASGVDAFATIAERAAAAADVGTPFLVLGDLNVPDFDAARQRGGWQRAPKARASSAPEAAAFAATLDAAGLTIVSGAVAGCGPDECAASTHFKPHVSPSELDFILANDAALALVAGSGTENGGRQCALAHAPWSLSHHRLVWVEIDVDTALVPPTEAAKYPNARWRSATSNTAALDAFAAELDARLADLVEELDADGLTAWRFNTQAVVRRIVAEIHAAQAAALGLAGRRRQFRPEPAWWNGDCDAATKRLADAADAFSGAAARGDADGTVRASAQIRDLRVSRDRVIAEAQAIFFEYRIQVEAAGDPRALAAVHTELRAQLGFKKERGGRGTATVWRALRTADGRLVSGTDIGAELVAQVTDAFRYDEGDPRFCATAAAALTSGMKNLRRDPAFAAECADATFAGGEAVATAEVTAAKASIKKGKVAHPGDGVVPEALIHGGATLDRAFALVFSAILDLGTVPADWRTGAMRCVYKRNDPTQFLNHRGVVLSSHVAKLFERVLLRRLIRSAEGVDELQAVANPGIDTRVQLHLLHDACLGTGGVWLMSIDITRGFPSTSRELAVAALRRHGVGGRLLRAIMGLIFGTSVVVGLRPGVDTPPVRLQVGLLEGTVLSPALFSYVTGGLLAALRASGRGVSVGNTWCGALMLMDDLVILARSEAELGEMAAVVFQWAFESRYVLALEKKSHVLRPLADADSTPTSTRLCWEPRTDDHARRAAAKIDVEFPHRESMLYLGLRLAASGGPEPHVLRQLALARATVERLEAEYGGRALVTLGHGILLWNLHGRVNLEWPAAVLPPSPQDVEDATKSYDALQHRALRALMGRSAVQSTYKVLLAVLGLWTLEERRLLARGRYAFVFAQTRRRPQRAALMAALCDRADADVKFFDESVTGAVARALRTLGYDDWPPLVEDAATDAVDDGAAPTDAAPAAADGPYDDDVGVRRPPRVPGDDADERDSGDDDDGDGRGSGDDDDGVGAGDDGVAEPAAAARRAWDADVHRRCVGVVADREARLWGTIGPRGGVTQGPVSAALWREIAGWRPSGATYASTRLWMRRCVLNLTADAAGAALLALLAGCWWAAPSAFIPDDAGRYAPARCGACGATSACLPLHLVTGAYGNEATCASLDAADVRAQWEKEVAATYAEHADARAAAALTAAPARSFRRTALMLGHAAGVHLPWSLSGNLPGAFVRTWGDWSATKLGPP